MYYKRKCRARRGACCAEDFFESICISSAKRSVRSSPVKCQKNPSGIFSLKTFPSGTSSERENPRGTENHWQENEEIPTNRFSNRRIVENELSRCSHADKLSASINRSSRRGFPTRFSFLVTNTKTLDENILVSRAERRLTNRRAGGGTGRQRHSPTEGSSALGVGRDVASQ